MLRLEREHFADDAQDVATAFAWRNEQFNLFGEEQQCDFVAVARSGKRQRGGNFGGVFALGKIARTERRRAGDIHRDHRRKFTFFAELFHKRTTEAIGDVPVYVAHVVAGHVFAQLLEVHAAPLEMAQVSTDHRVVDEAVGAQLHAADGFEQFGDGHGKFMI